MTHKINLFVRDLKYQTWLGKCLCGLAGSFLMIGMAHADLLAIPHADEPIFTEIIGTRDFETVSTLDETWCFHGSDGRIYLIDIRDMPNLKHHVELTEHQKSALATYFTEDMYVYDRCVGHKFITMDPNIQKQLGNSTTIYHAIVQKSVSDQSTQPFFQAIQDAVVSGVAQCKKTAYAKCDDIKQECDKQPSLSAEDQQKCQDQITQCRASYDTYFTDDPLKEMDRVLTALDADLIAAYKREGYAKPVNGKVISKEYDTLFSVKDGAIINKMPVIDCGSELVYTKSDIKGADRLYVVDNDKPFTGDRLLSKETKQVGQEAPFTLLTLQYYKNGYPQDIKTEKVVAKTISSNSRRKIITYTSQE